MKKNVLIFTASTGQGHNTVADSLDKELVFHGYNVLTIEPLKEVSKSLDLLIADGYKVLATKLPKMYGGLYKLSNHELTNHRISRILIKALENKIYELINIYNPSLVISTHPLIVNVISVLKEQEEINVPFISVITDYQAHQSYINKNVDAYIVGSTYTKQSLIKKGISEDKIYTFGIPIRREFHVKANSLKKEEIFTILLMGGSMGVNGIKKALKNLMEVEYPIRIIVVCGNNKSLKKSIENKYDRIQDNKIIDILGFTKDIPKLMDIADITISKPGGLTATEALVKCVPMIIPYYIPGQERENTEVLVTAGAAKNVQVKELSIVITELITQPQLLEEMKENIRNITKTHSLDSTIHLAINLIEEYDECVERRVYYER